MKKIRTIFMATSSFAVPVLEAALELDFLDITAVVTQPDRQVGRKQVLTAPPIKELLITNYELRIKDGFNIYQPEKIRMVYKEILEKEQPELILVASYGQILPNNLLQFPKYGALNLHVSLLPELRGAVPMPMAILQGLKKTGVTLQKMVYELDEGPIIATREFELEGTETTPDVEKRSAELSIDILQRDLPRWIAGEIEPRDQNYAKATYCTASDIAKDKAEITFETDVEYAERMVRAFTPWPIAWLTLHSGIHTGKRLKIYKAKLQNSKIEILEKLKVQKEPLKNHDPQLLTHSSIRIYKEKKRLYLQLHDGVLELLEVQLEGKKRGQASEYLFLVD